MRKLRPKDEGLIRDVCVIQANRFQADTVEVGARGEDCEDERPAKARTRGKSVGPCVKCKEASLSGPFCTDIIYGKKDAWGETFFKSVATPMLSNKCPLALKKEKKKKNLCDETYNLGQTCSMTEVVLGILYKMSVSIF